MNTSPITLPEPLPRVWRHHYSGVWFGYLLGQSIIPGHLKFEGRRVYNWRGDRLECSQLAKIGLKPQDVLGEWTTVDIMVEGSVEVLPTTVEFCEIARTLKGAKQ